MGKFEKLINEYGEGRLLEDVYVGNLTDLEYEDVVYTIEEDDYFLKELVRRLTPHREDGYSQEELEEDAEQYHKGLLKMIRETSLGDRWRETVQDIITEIHKKYGEGLLYNRDIVRVFVGVIPYIEYENREQVVRMYLVKDLYSRENKPLRENLEENAPKYIRENKSFKEVVNVDTVETYDDFIEDLEFPYIMKGKEYEDLVVDLLPNRNYDDIYLYYLEILEDRIVDKGKEDAIKELSKMCPERFEDEKVWEYGVADLGNYTLTWRDEVRITTRGYTMDGYPKQEWKIKSSDEYTLMKFIEYYNLYGAFLGQTVDGL